MKKEIVVLVPYPAQGHVSPMQKLAWGFIGQGFEAVMVLPEFIHRQIMDQGDYEKDDDVKWIGLEDGLGLGHESPDFFGIESVMENSMPRQLQSLLGKLAEQGHVACVVVDLLASWAIKVAFMCAIPCAAFWPAMFASYLFISSIPHLLRRALISHSGLPEHEGKFCLEPQLPVISTADLPWLIGTDAAKKARFKFWKRTLERSNTLKWLLVNSFPNESNLDHQTQVPTTKFSSQQEQGCPRVLPIGPICWHNQLTKNVSFWEEDLSCLKWLAKQKRNSVVYISFGSWVSPIGEAKLKNVALALEASARPFIWVLRSTWRQGLPLGFLERVVKQGRGIVVSWAPQNQILQHQNVACYITHCGWNSILEALQFQKKLLCYPVAGDQFVNCAYVVQVWRVGLKLNGFEPKEVEQGLVKVIQDKEMDTRLKKLHERIFGMQGGDNNKTGAFMFKTFVDDLKLASSTTTTITENFT